MARCERMWRYESLAGACRAFGSTPDFGAYHMSQNWHYISNGCAFLNYIHEFLELVAESEGGGWTRDICPQGLLACASSFWNPKVAVYRGLNESWCLPHRAMILLCAWQNFENKKCDNFSFWLVRLSEYCVPLFHKAPDCPCLAREANI